MIQLQPTRFYYNWIKAQETQIYPRYSQVYKAFVDWLAKFIQFVATNDVGVIDQVEYNLTYVNIIPQGHGWNSFKDIHKVLPDICWKKTRKRRYVSEPADFNFRYIFPIRDQPGRVTATIQRGIPKADQLPVLRLELAAQATVADGLPKHSEQSRAQWFEAANSCAKVYELVPSEKPRCNQPIRSYIFGKPRTREGLLDRPGPRPARSGQARACTGPLLGTIPVTPARSERAHVLVGKLLAPALRSPPGHSAESRDRSIGPGAERISGILARRRTIVKRSF